MHEISLGGVLCDYLTGEAREHTTYEDLRQALARFLVEERGYSPNSLLAHFAISYTVDAQEHTREADIAVQNEHGAICALVLFCPGQVHTYQREAAALARLLLPFPSPLVVVTDTKDAELFTTSDMRLLAKGLAALPVAAALFQLTKEHPCQALTNDQREKESRILHAYTGFLKTCCTESCVL